MKDKNAHTPSEWQPIGNPVKERFDLLPPRALARAAQIRADAAKDHGDQAIQEWIHSTTPDQHVNKALIHLYMWLQGDRSEDHLGHTLCRAMFAVELDALREEQMKAMETTARSRTVVIPDWACHCVRIIDGSWIDTQSETNMVPYWGDNHFGTNKDCPDCHGDGGLARMHLERDKPYKETSWTFGSNAEIGMLVCRLTDLALDSPSAAESVLASMSAKFRTAIDQAGKKR